MNKFFNILGIVIFFILVLFPFASAEDLTITTYYPSPYGSYNELSTASNTYLATTGGNVGIGTTVPAAKLEVYGSSKINGQITIADGTQGNGKILRSDANGLASWSTGGACVQRTFSATSGTQECPAGYSIPMAPLTPTATSGIYLCCRYE